MLSIKDTAATDLIVTLQKWDYFYQIVSFFSEKSKKSSVLSKISQY